MKNMTSTQIEEKIMNSPSIEKLQINLLKANDEGFEFGTSHILSDLPVWGKYAGDTEGIYSWDDDHILDADFKLIKRCKECRYAQFACKCD